MPYMNWERCDQYRALATTYNQAQLNTPPESSERQASLIEKLSPREKIERDLSGFLKVQNGKSLHPRRTLDQSYYSSLWDTTDRDQDQTMSKWTGDQVGVNRKADADDDRLMIMIDQLWCFILDESKSDSSSVSTHLY